MIVEIDATDNFVLLILKLKKKFGWQKRDVQK